MNTMVAPKVVPSYAVVYAELGEEAVLLNVESGVYYGLDAVGTRIWQLLAAGSSVEDMVSQMREEYDVAPAQLAQDVQTFLEMLAAKDLTRNVER